MPRWTAISEALFYKPNDALANFRMAQAFEKLDQPDDAVEHYEEYLKILPNGPLGRRSEEGAGETESRAGSGKTKPSNKSYPCHPERSRSSLCETIASRRIPTSARSPAFLG